MNASDSMIENDRIIADFLRGLENILSDAEVAVAWGRQSRELAKQIQSTRAQIQHVRRAAILQFNQAQQAIKI